MRGISWFSCMKAMINSIKKQLICNPGGKVRMCKQVIMCVDDEKIILQSLKNELQDLFNYEFKIEIAETGEEALEVFSGLIKIGYEIPVVIVDYIMPGMKGDDLLKAIHDHSPLTQKIMLSGQATTDGIANAINHANLFWYIEKPWGKEELSKAILEALSVYNHKNELNREQKKLINSKVHLENKIEETISELRELESKYINQEDTDCILGLTKKLKVLTEFSEDLNKISTNLSRLEVLGNIDAEGNIQNFNGFSEEEKKLYESTCNLLVKILEAFDGHLEYKNNKESSIHNSEESLNKIVVELKQVSDRYFNNVFHRSFE